MRRYCPTALVLIAIVISACGPQPAETGAATPAGRKQPTPIPAPAKGQGFSVLAGRIIKRPDRYQGQTVTLVGYFRGLDLLNQVVLDAPVSRLTDWVIADDSGAIWVAYSGKLPFSPSSHDVWRIVRVSGTVEVHRNGMPYIVPTNAEWEGLLQEYSVLPALGKVAIHRFGGPQNLDHHIYWYDTRSLSVIDSKENWNGQTRLKQGENFDLETAFNKVKFFKLPENIGEACTGCMRYYVAALDPKTNEPHFVTVYEGSVPDKLQAFIDMTIAHTAEAKPIE